MELGADAGAAAVGVLAALSSWSLAGMAVGMGAADPRFHEDNPARIASSVGGVLFMLLGMTYLVVMVALLAWPISTFSFWLGSGYVPSGGRLVLQALLLAAALGLSVLAHVFPRRLGAARLAAREG